jgi:hypothetical protein
MTRDKGIMIIFCQNVPFLEVLIIWRVIVQALVVQGVIRKMTDNLESSIVIE